jgi:hypothetical protein
MAKLFDRETQPETLNKKSLLIRLWRLCYWLRAQPLGLSMKGHACSVADR